MDQDQTGYEPDELAVTPAMREAGWAVVNECVEIDAAIDQDWLDRAYIAMRALDPSHRSGGSSR
jgi:hypothetical protein